MNVKKTNAFFKEHEIVALKADKGNESRINEMLALMKELGNSKEAIPFYAIFGPGLDEPLTASGPITSGWVYESLEKAKANSSEETTITNSEVSETQATHAVEATKFKS